MGQIREATRPDREKSLYGQDIPSLWASQPGMLWTYKAKGGFAEAFKLYSSRSLRVSNSLALLDDAELIRSWESQPHRFDDINRPAIT
ncbi:hypothetical protein OAN94_02335 [Verrucomicrobiales bacterium]|nr:hypothetical protein [Verrucomicrobiales bacterium]MDF1786007.1 hypothetical protein [Verrucomicrobiales bacterium]